MTDNTNLIALLISIRETARANNEQKTVNHIDIILSEIKESGN